MNTTEATILSPYQCAGVVNKMLEDLEVDKTLPPQMFYTYVKKGYIPSHLDASGKVKVDREDLVEWFENKYAPKNLKTETESEESQETEKSPEETVDA